MNSNQKQNEYTHTLLELSLMARLGRETVRDGESNVL